MTRFHLDRAALVLGVTALLAVTASGPQSPAHGDPQSGPPSPPGAPGPFTDVPAGHPAYTVVDYVTREGGGLFTGFSEGTFSGRRRVTRYEFAVAVQNLHQRLGRELSRLEPPKPALRGVPSFYVPVAPMKVAEGLRDPARRVKLLAWFSPLLVEFGDTAKLLGMDAQKARKEVDAWLESAAGSVPSGRDEKPAETATGKEGGMKDGGPFSDLPLNSPAYGTIELLWKLGLFTGYPEGTVAGKRALTRYEFAEAAQRMAQELDQAYRLQTGEATPPPRTGPADRFGPEPAVSIDDTFKEPQARLRLLAWYSPMLREFDAELRMLGADPARMRRYLETWQAGADSSTARPGDSETPR